jgi:twitching motility protein PilT
VVALEVMLVTSTVQEYIMEMESSRNLTQLIEKGRSQYGTQSFDQHLRDLYNGGVITLRVALKAATNPSDFRRSLTIEE